MTRAVPAALAPSPRPTATVPRTGVSTTSDDSTVPLVLDALDVLCVPAGHPYVEHLLPVTGASGVRHRRDPDPDDPSRDAVGRWWPPVALDPAWLVAHRPDVLHLHFGFDDRSPADLARLLQVAHDLDVPVVLTVHDLRNPHQVDRSRLDAQLDVLVPGADAVLTLTAAAAAEVERRWARTAVVVPHPHLVDLDLAARLRAARRTAQPGETGSGPVVGLAVKSLRPNTDPLHLLPTLERAVAGVAGARLRVSAHHDLRDRDDEPARALVAWLDGAAGSSAEARPVEVQWHDRWDDEELARRLAELQVAVLPYAFGTHSGWLEACHDVGTRVLAPAHGCYADQGADGVFDDLASLETELVRLLQRDPRDLAGPEPHERAAQREQVAAAHERLYRDLLSARPLRTARPHRRSSSEVVA